MPASRPLRERLFEKIYPEPNSGCWLWGGFVNPSGYGIISIGNRKNAMAHRVSYEFHKGKIPDGLFLDHLCRVRCCVNPDHLEAVTQSENVRRGNSLAAQNARKTHCINGHPLEGKNLLKRKEGRRGCRQCDREAGRKYYRRMQNASAN